MDVQVDKKIIKMYFKEKEQRDLMTPKERMELLYLVGEKREAELKEEIKNDFPNCKTEHERGVIIDKKRIIGDDLWAMLCNDELEVFKKYLGINELGESQIRKCLVKSILWFAALMEERLELDEYFVGKKIKEVGGTVLDFVDDETWDDKREYF